MSRMNMIKRIQALILIMVFFPAVYSWADITINLKEPKWEFLFNNQPWESSDAQLAAAESSFARSLQPLLAIQNHKAIIEAFEKRNIDTDSAALRLLRGQVLLSLKRYNDAEQALQLALQTMPNLALAHRSLSMVYIQGKQYDQAQKHLTRSIELGVADAQVYGQLAFVNLQLGQAASAVAGYQYALFLQANNKQWRQGLLYALIQSQAFDQAQALVEEMLHSEPNNAGLWLQRGQIALKKKRSDQAIASMEVALQLDVKDADNIATTAQLHIQSGSPRRAVDLLEEHTNILVKAGKIDVLDQISAWLAFQQDWRQLDRLTRSLEYSKVKVPARYRSRFAVYQAQVSLSKTKTYKNKKHQKMAYQNLRKAIDIDPSNGEALLTLATLLRDQNRSEPALLYYIRAEAIPTFKVRGLLGRAQLEIDRQNYSEALRLLHAVAKNDPGRSDVLANIQSLQHLVRSQG